MTRSSTNDEAKSLPQSNQWNFPVNMSPLAMMEAGKPATTPLEAWISLFPASPLFGVRWVMWDMMRLGAGMGAGMGMGGGAGALGQTAARSSAAHETEVLSMPDARPLPPRQPQPTPVAPVAPVAVEPAPIPEPAPVEPVIEIAQPPAIDAAPERVEPAPRPANLLTAPPARIDDLKLIKGVGPRLETRLNELGVYLFAQIAEFTEEDFAWLDDHLAALFRGRAVRDGWAEQAKVLRDQQG